MSARSRRSLRCNASPTSWRRSTGSSGSITTSRKAMRRRRRRIITNKASNQARGRSLIGGSADQTRRDVSFEPAGAVMEFRPVVEGEIDHDQPGGRQFFVEAFTGFDVARADQFGGEIVQSRIVTDQQQRASIVGF